MYDIKDVIVDELKGSADHVDKETYEKRKEICFRCDHIKTVIPMTGGTCGLCGCFVRLKTRYKESVCPDNPPRW